MSARLTRIDPARLPARTRRVLDGVDEILVHRLEMTTRFRRVTSRDGLLLHGPAGWGEASPFWDYGPEESSAWLSAAVDAAVNGCPAPLRPRVDVNVTIPVCPPDEARARVLSSGGCATAKIKVADPGSSPSDDVARVEAVADALASSAPGRGRIRVDANSAWDEDEAVRAIGDLDRAAAAVGGLEYVEQPCPRVDELAAVRRRVAPPIAADESIRRAEDPLAVARAGAADVAVIKVAPLGGPARALDIAASTELRVVVSSALESSVGLAVGAMTAAALPGEPLACGLATAQLLADDVAGPLEVRDGSIPAAPLAPDLSLVDRDPVAPGLVARWLGRLDAMCAHLDARRGAR
ncbi:o-succinylbenzoate synthase [Actinomyces sp. B33]|uniref:o-succinylbenzoate synthase n=1 Tax=Actinomyces sp. B33 TaxID=2942131 RepID=UPI00233F9C0A|nr:o-succinylbenzoate synthase [Actinomyces sp. B33]MDC4233537.1 o-succinylbenzoate synthase [Actinomyces sp. B33]